jgi:hypothetical protein
LVIFNLNFQFRKNFSKTAKKLPMTFQSVGDFDRKEQQLTLQLESEQFWSSLENTNGKFRR